MNIRFVGKNLGLAGVSLALFFCLSQSNLGLEKRLEITVAQAPVHMQPNARSPILETLSRGDVVTLASARKFRRVWNYVYFASSGSGTLKSGYIHDDTVTKLYDSVKCISYEENGGSSHVSRRSSESISAVRWGMAMNEVKNSLGEPSSSTVMNDYRILRYFRDVAGIACNIDYLFSSQNRLVKTRYSFAQEHAEKNAYIADFIKLNEYFSEQYGKPQREEQIWHDPRLKNDPAKWGYAVSLGHLSYQTRWVVSETQIILNLFGIDDKVSLEVLYTYLNL